MTIPPPTQGTANPIPERLTLVLLRQLARIPFLAARLHRRVGLIHISHGRPEAAVSNFQAALAGTRSGHPDTHHQLGQALLGSDRAADAVASFRNAVALQPKAFWSYQGLGESLMHQGLLADAEQALRQGLALQPDQGWLYYHLVNCLAEQGRGGEALDTMLQAASWSVPEPLTLFPPGHLYDALITPGRLQSLREIVDRLPEHRGYSLLLCRMLALRGEYREATEFLRHMALQQWQRLDPRPAMEAAADGTQKKPSFLIIGQVKAGTSALYRYLCQHPSVVPALLKEVCYWSEHHAAGPDWYQAHFPPIPADTDLVTGEASHQYLTDALAPTRIAQAMPRVKLIVLLRDPVARAYSEYQMWVRLGREGRSWEEIVATELAALPVCPLDAADLGSVSATDDQSNYLLRGAALPFLRRWLSVFPRERVLILRSSDMRRDTPESVRRMQRFLGLTELTPDCSKPINVGRYPPMATATEQRLQAWFAHHQQALDIFLET